MDVYKLSRNQRCEASRLISAGIGALIQQHPELITQTVASRQGLGTKIITIFDLCERQILENKPGNSAQAFTLLEPIQSKLGFKFEEVHKSSRLDLLDYLDRKTLLQARTGEHTTVFGQTKGKYWRFDSQVTDEASALMIYENLAEFKEVLRKLKDPEFTLIKASPVSQRLRAKL